MFINIITGKEYYVDTISKIPGNLENRGLVEDFVYINDITIEYSRLAKQLTSGIHKGTRNTIKGLADMHNFLKTYFKGLEVK